MLVPLQEVRPENLRVDRRLVEYNIRGHEMIEKNVVNAEEGRDLLLCVRENLSYSEVIIEQQYCENLCIKVRCKNKNILIASIYRSPSSNMAENDKLLKVMEEISNKQFCYKIILGDFNLPNINWTNYTATAGINSVKYKFIATVRYCFLMQHMQEITRQRGEVRGSVLDLIFRSEEEIVEEIEVESPIG